MQAPKQCGLFLLLLPETAFPPVYWPGRRPSSWGRLDLTALAEAPSDRNSPAPGADVQLPPEVGLSPLTLSTPCKHREPGPNVPPVGSGPWTRVAPVLGAAVASTWWLGHANWAPLGPPAAPTHPLESKTALPSLHRLVSQFLSSPT